MGTLLTPSIKTPKNPPNGDSSEWGTPPNGGLLRMGSYLKFQVSRMVGPLTRAELLFLRIDFVGSWAQGSVHNRIIPRVGSILKIKKSFATSGEDPKTERNGASDPEASFNPPDVKDDW